MSSSRNNLGYVPELDGIRGVAILAVMLYHLGELCSLSGFVEGGHTGVDIFFVLSGFLITAIIVREFDASGRFSFRNFYMRRVLRLGPALLALLITFSAFCYLFLNEFWYRYNLKDSLITLFYMSNWARALRIHSLAFLGHTWSLSIEEQFYMLWPVMLILLLKYLRSRWMVAVVPLAAAVAAFALRVWLLHGGAAMERLYNGLDTRADSLLVGCGLGVILTSRLLDGGRVATLSRLSSYLSPVCLVSLLLIASSVGWKSYQLYYWVFFAVAVLTAVLIFDVVANEKSIVRPVFSMKWLIWVGRLSYGLYLWHYPVYKAMMIMGFTRMQIITIGTLVTFLLVVASYYLLEQPLLRLKKRFGGASAVDARPCPDARVQGTVTLGTES